MRCFGIITLLLLGGILFAGFEILQEESSTLTVRQCDGRTLVLTKKSERTVICYASLAQVWYCAGGSAVGISQVSSKNTLPPAARELPAVGGTTMPNAEKVLSMRPALVLLNAKYERHRAFQRILDRSGVESMLLEYNTYDDFLKLFDLFSRLNGSIGPEAAAKRIAEEVDAVCSRARREPAVRFAVLFVTADGFSAEPSAMQNALMASRLGGVNILKSSARTRQKLSMEALLAADPEVIFLVTPAAGEEDRRNAVRPLLAHPAWKRLSAAECGRVHVLPSELFLFQPGPRFPEAFRLLARLLHPGTDFGPAR